MRLVNILSKYIFVSVKSKYFFLMYKKCPEVPLYSRKGGILQTVGTEEINLKGSKIYHACVFEMNNATYYNKVRNIKLLIYYSITKQVWKAQGKEKLISSETILS